MPLEFIETVSTVLLNVLLCLRALTDIHAKSKSRIRGHASHARSISIRRDSHER